MAFKKALLGRTLKSFARQDFDSKILTIFRLSESERAGRTLGTVQAGSGLTLVACVHGLPLSDCMLQPWP